MGNLCDELYVHGASCDFGRIRGIIIGTVDIMQIRERDEDASIFERMCCGLGNEHDSLRLPPELYQ